jgi:peptidoglycan/xylan/chitin deacetylase (PgdA/CDA1 family)
MLRWMRQPQLLATFVVVCLCIGALGSLAKSMAAPPSIAPKRQSPSVKGIHTQAIPNCAVAACIALSFDDGPNDAVTPRILDILERQQVKATFFLVGQHVAGREPTVRRMYSDGHEIGNHSWSHADFSKLSPAEVDSQIRLAQAAIAGAGVPAPRLFRPPYGSVDQVVMSHVGMTVVRWNIDPEDWKVRNAAAIHQKVMADARPGGIILMHDTDPATADALEPILIDLKQHYRLITVSQLMRLSPGDQGQYFGR